jgi:membrane associated rhomboid family serine protease
MLPLGDDNYSRRVTPVVTYVFIALNVLVFFLELNSGNAFIDRWAFVPARFLSDPAGDAVTLLTSMFMHAGWLHLLGNMLYLWIFGDNVEDRLGHGMFAVFYVLSGLGATFAQLAFSLDSSIPNLGASGAIAGVLGAYILMFPQGRVRVLMGRGIVPLPALVVIGFWIVIQVFSGIDSIAVSSQTGDQGGVAYMAHVGGFFTGLILAFLLGGSNRALPRSVR